MCLVLLEIFSSCYKYQKKHQINLTVTTQQMIIFHCNCYMLWLSQTITKYLKSAFGGNLLLIFVLPTNLLRLYGGDSSIMVFRRENLSKFCALHCTAFQTSFSYHYFKQSTFQREDSTTKIAMLRIVSPLLTF